MRLLVTSLSAAALCAVALVGCAVGPDHVKPKDGLGEAHLEPRADYADAIETFDQHVPSQWWTLFNDATLTFYLGNIQDYRPMQMAPLALIVALPQLFLGPAVALLLSQKWADARMVFAAGLGLIALACFSGMQLTSDWNRDQFVVAQTLHAFGQPMAVVSLLFLATSVVQPSEGPYVSGTINTLRAFGSLAGAAAVSQLMTVRSRFHMEMMLDHAALAGSSVTASPAPALLMRIVGQQSLVLAVADAFLVLGLLALLLIPLVLRLTYIPAPNNR